MKKSIQVILVTILVLSLMTAIVFAGTELAAGEVAVAAPANTPPGITILAGTTAQVVNVTVLANDGNIPKNDNNNLNGWVAVPSSYTIESNGAITIGSNTIKYFTPDKNFSLTNETLTFPINISATPGAQAKRYDIPVIISKGNQVNLKSDYTIPTLYVTVVAPNQNTTTGGFVPPLKDGAVYKIGRTLPVKFKAPTVTSSTGSAPTAFISLEYKGNERNVIIPTVISRSSASKDNLFRYDNLSNQYIYNLNTNNIVPGKYLIKATLSNGTSYSVLVTFEGKTNNSNAPTKETPKQAAPTTTKTTNKK